MDENKKKVMYQNNLKNFFNDVRCNVFIDIIEKNYEIINGYKISRNSEFNSWKTSGDFIKNLLEDIKNP